MASEFRFASHFLNTHVFILDCLPSSETSRERLYNPLRDLAADGGIRKGFPRWCVSDSRMLKGLLQTIAVWAGAGIMPIIHIECHGIFRDEQFLNLPAYVIADAQAQLSEFVANDSQSPIAPERKHPHQ